MAESTLVCGPAGTADDALQEPSEMIAQEAASADTTSSADSGLLDTPTYSPPSSSGTCLNTQGKFECTAWLLDPLYAPLAEAKVSVKLLVSNAAAGSIIGKGGSTIGDLQTKSKARLQLTKAGDVFPGTAERVLTLTGLHHCTVTALEIVLHRLLRERISPLEAKEHGKTLLHDPCAPDDEQEMQLRMVIPTSMCGKIIGRGGSVVGHLMANSGSRIRVLLPEMAQVGLQYRLVSLSGCIEALLKGVALTVKKMMEDPGFSECNNQPLLPPSPPLKMTDGFSPSPHGSPTGPLPPPLLHGVPHLHYISVTIHVPCDQVDDIRERGECSLWDLQHATGASICVLPPHEGPHGHWLCALVISGQSHCVHAAHAAVVTLLDPTIPEPSEEYMHSCALGCPPYHPVYPPYSLPCYAAPYSNTDENLDAAAAPHGSSPDSSRRSSIATDDTQFCAGFPTGHIVPPGAFYLPWYPAPGYVGPGCPPFMRQFGGYPEDPACCHGGPYQLGDAFGEAPYRFYHNGSTRRSKAGRARSRQSSDGAVPWAQA